MIKNDDATKKDGEKRRKILIKEIGFHTFTCFFFFFFFYKKDLQKLNTLQQLLLIILPNPFTNEIIKFYYLICTFPVPNSLFSHLFTSFPLFSHLFAQNPLFAI